MAARVKIEGLKELDAALGELSKGAARGVLRRTLIKAGEPMRAAAERLAPRDKGDLAESIELSSKIDNIGDVITVVVTGTNGAGSASAESAGTAAVIGA